MDFSFPPTDVQLMWHRRTQIRRMIARPGWTRSYRSHFFPRRLCFVNWPLSSTDDAANNANHVDRSAVSQQSFVSREARTHSPFIQPYLIAHVAYWLI